MVAPINDSTENGRERRKGNVRLVIADDHPIVRDGLKKLLQLEDDFEVVGEASDGREVLEKVRELDPDVLLAGSAHAQPGRSVGAAGAAANQQANARDRADRL